MDSFPVIHLKGSHYDIGLAHGQALAQEIRGNLKLYYDMIHGMNGMARGRALEQAREFRLAIEEAAPHLVEEMEGIARGSETTIDEILLLNARTEIMSMPPAAECTAIGLTGERTSNNRTLLAQNWDWHHRVREGSAVFKIEPAQRPKALILAEAGQVGKIGLNDRGLGVLLNILMTGETAFGLPIHVMLRMVLESGHAVKAAETIKKSKIGSASNFLIGDTSGYVVTLELSPSGIGEILPESGMVFHTNHFCDPVLAEKDLGPDLFVDSIPRYRRAGKVLSGRDKWDVESLKELFVNHEDGPASICRHVDEDQPEHLHMATLASCILDLDRRRMQITCGQPCQTPYHEVNLND